MNRDANVWRMLEADPEFVAAMERAREDFAAGRVVTFRSFAKAPPRPRCSERWLSIRCFAEAGHPGEHVF